MKLSRDRGTAQLRDPVIKSDGWVVKYFRVGMCNWHTLECMATRSVKFILVMNWALV